MSSHREAPEISKDPVADSTDVYAFVSPDRPSTVTLIANYIPLEEPAGGPNFYEFGDDVLYAIHIDTNGDGAADITYQFQFTTRLRNPDTFLYKHRPDPVAEQPELEQPPVLHGHPGRGRALQAAGHPAWPARRATSGRCPPPVRDPGGQRGALPARWRQGVRGPARRGFYVDLGSIFDLATLRPFQQLQRQVRHARLQ